MSTMSWGDIEGGLILIAFWAFVISVAVAFGHREKPAAGDLANDLLLPDDPWQLPPPADPLGVFSEHWQPSAPPADDPEALFLPADSFKAKAISWAWPGVMARGNLTLLGGAPGMGKSQTAIYAAATVSRGGTWPDGSQAQRGSVLLFETEDPIDEVVLPRLRAVGADLSRVKVRQTPMDLSTNMDALAAQAARLPDLRLLVLSPVLTFFGATSNDDNTVRTKLRPLFEWAAARDVAVLGIIHPLKQGSPEVFAGCDAYRRACRAAWRLVLDPNDPQPVEKLKRRMMVAAKVNIAPDTLNLTYKIEGVMLPDGIETSRVRFVQAGAQAVSSPPHQPSPNGGGGEQASSDGAADFLCRVLAHGPMDATTLKRLAAEAGISSMRALYDAAQSLRVEIERPARITEPSVWRLP